MALLCLPSWAPYPSVTLRTLSGGFAGTLSLFSLSCREPSTVARMAETSLSSWRSASRGLGKSTLPRPHLPSSCPWTRHSGPRGSTSVWFPLLLHCVRVFCKSFYSFFFFLKKKNLKLHLLLKWLMHWWVMNSPWERPKGQSGSGETQLIRPSYCLARPCCTWAPSSFSFYQSQTQGQGRNPHLSFSCQLQMVCLACPLPNCNHRDKKLLLQLSLSPLPKFSIPASNLGIN